jgi:hypothetical protein
MKTKTSEQIEMEELFASACRPRPLTELERARALSRARKVIRSPVHLMEAPKPRLTRFAGRALIAAAGLIVGIAGAALAHTGLGQAERAFSTPAVATPLLTAAPAVALPAAAIPAQPFAAASVAAAAAPSASPRPARAASGEASFGAESELLRRAHSAYAQGDFGTALKLVAEHAKKFPRGVLAEEREALRVRSLAGTGQSAAASRAAAAFAEHFPRSVLLPRIQRFSAANVERER